MNIIPLSVPTPFYIGDVNVYLIKDDPLTLIDTGPKTAETEAALREKLRRNGVDFSDIKRILLTHAHEDHCGLAGRIRDEANGAEIFVHRWESGHLFGAPDHAAIDDFLVRAGTPGAILKSLRKIAAQTADFSDALNENQFSDLADDAEIEFAAGVLRVLHTPGHTPGSCCFLREANRTLVAGDTILKRLTPNPMLAPDPFDKNKRFQSLGEYTVSLAKIKAHAPTLVYGGHGEPINDFGEIFHRYLRSIDERQKLVVAALTEDGATAYAVAEKLFPSAANADFHRFLAISETVAHLDYAEAENKIAVEIKEGAEFYRRL